mmetsp:Transcript_27013/g.74230  ORF Transcript_27013/g.74230 Transcript_27013/m.74230 type:complete len:86 (+) Transcript_27013:605-862(+)
MEAQSGTGKGKTWKSSSDSNALKIRGIQTLAVDGEGSPRMQRQMNRPPLGIEKTFTCQRKENRWTCPEPSKEKEHCYRLTCRNHP